MRNASESIKDLREKATVYVQHLNEAREIVRSRHGLIV